MTEQEWQTASDHPQGMVTHLHRCKVSRTKAGRRKLRLFACGCCRVVWHILPNRHLQEAVQAAERFAEGLTSKEELASVYAAVRPLRSDSGPFGKAARGVRVAIDMAVMATDHRPYEAAFYMTATQAPLAGCLPEDAAEAYICHLIRCVFGNPFRSPPFPRSWRNSTVVNLAQSIFNDFAFDRMPLLADALEEAGCRDAEILNHCRQPGEHCRGCWVVDLILGKS